MSNKTKEGCHICTRWTPTQGCIHYLPTASKKAERPDMPLYVKTVEDMAKHIARLEETIRGLCKHQSISLCLDGGHVTAATLDSTNYVRVAYSNPRGAHHTDIDKATFARTIKSLIDAPWEEMPCD